MRNFSLQRTWAVFDVESKAMRANAKAVSTDGPVQSVLAGVCNDSISRYLGPQLVYSAQHRSLRVWLAGEIVMDSIGSPLIADNGSIDKPLSNTVSM